MRKRSAVRELRFDELAIAVEAVVSGNSVSAWETLAGFCDREGVDYVAAALARRSGLRGGSERWWRCNLLLSRELSVDEALEVLCEIVEIEARGEGPAFDADRQALEVSSAVRYLQAHLDLLRTGAATRLDRLAVDIVVRAARIARRHSASEVAAQES